VVESRAEAELSLNSTMAQFADVLDRDRRTRRSAGACLSMSSMRSGSDHDARLTMCYQAPRYQRAVKAGSNKKDSARTKQ
jgi:hypothetical protein